MNDRPKKSNRIHAFVTTMIDRINKDKRMTAILKRADNPATEYQSWEYLAAFNVNLDKDYERLPYTTIAAAIAKAKIIHNGKLGIGKAIARCYSDNKSDQAKSKLRRLLACDTTQEVCRILRPIFSLIQSKNIPNLDFVGLLEDLLGFNWEERRQRIKSRWAQDFYYRDTKETDMEEAI